MMKKTALLILTFGLVGFSLAAERNFEKLVKVDGDLRFSLDSHKGSINIKTTADDTIDIKARIYSDELSAEDLEKLKIVVTEGAGYVNVDVDYDAWHDSFTNFVRGRNHTPHVDFDILIPDYISLDVETHKADFEIQAPSGEVELETHKGNGTITGVRSDIEIETHKGNVRVEMLEMADIEVETHKGHVKFIIQDEPNFSIRGESHKGNFSFSGVEVPLIREDREVSISHTVGDGQHRIELETHKGNISFEFVN